MSKQSDVKRGVPTFEPVPVRPRRDGWTPEKQGRFVTALMVTGSVTEAARSVGMSARSAHELRARRDAGSFRAAWTTAIAAGVPALTDAAMERALHGVVVPVFYKGEQVGERRVFNEALTMFLLRHHDQHRYGKWRDKMMVARADPDGETLFFHEAVRRLVSDCIADQIGQPRERHQPLRTERIGSDPEAETRDAQAQARLMEMRRQAEWEAFERQLAAERAAWEANAGADKAAGRSHGGAGSSRERGSSELPHEGEE